MGELLAWLGKLTKEGGSLRGVTVGVARGGVRGSKVFFLKTTVQD